MTGKYKTEVDLKNSNSSQSLIVQLTGPGKRVLDVGTATGYVAKALVKRGCEVTGVEINPEAAEQAEEHCKRVIVGDIESMDLAAELGDETFDVIVFGDLLEHLKEPLQTLERFKSFLNSEGYVISSIPNIAHGSVRLALLQGEFRYRTLGLLDDTHLRFFTLDSVKQLFADAGFLIDVLERTRLGIFATEIEVDRDTVPEETLDRIRKDPEALTYQFVLTAYPSGGSPM
ncbi:MAG: class I SAM-dependent methyltransferase, partial [Rubrobacteraceae bacterium]